MFFILYMAENKLTKSFIDPETGEVDDITFKTEINGWIYDEDRNNAAIVWKSVEVDGVYVGWEKTGGHTWSTWLSIPGEIRRNTGYYSFSTAEKALEKAEEIMKLDTPKQAKSQYTN